MLVPSAAFTGGSSPCSTDYAAVSGTVSKRAHHTTWVCTLQMPSGTGTASAMALLQLRISLRPLYTVVSMPRESLIRNMETAVQMGPFSDPKNLGIELRTSIVTSTPC